MRPEALIYFEGRLQCAVVLSAPNAIGCVSLRIGTEEVSRHVAHIREPNAEARRLLESGWKFVKKDPETVAVDVAKAADMATLPTCLSEWTLEEVELLRAYWQVRLREAQASRAKNKMVAIGHYQKVLAASKLHIKRIRTRASAAETGLSEDEIKDPDVLLKAAREVLWGLHRETTDEENRVKIKKIARAIDLHLGRFQSAGLS